MEREYHINGLAGYIMEGIYGTDPLESDSLQWRDIVEEAVKRMFEQNPEIEDYRESKMNDYQSDEMDDED